MAEHNEFGKEGEEEAAAYLIDKGYSIRHRNWHCGKKELDIVAEYRNELIVIACIFVLVAVVALVSSLLLVFQLSATEEYPQIR